MSQASIQKMSSEPEKLVGVDDPNFRMVAGQTYAENLMHRYRSNHAMDSQPSIEIQQRAVELVKYMEEFAIPHAITSYKSGQKINTVGKIRWGIKGWTTTKMVVQIHFDRREFIIQTPLATYSVCVSIVERCQSMFEAVPNVEVKSEWLRSRESDVIVFYISFPIDGI